jgi:hypothetical protein
MKSSFFFDTITVGVPTEKIYRRLGYRQGITRLQLQEKEEIDQAIEDALALIRLGGVAVPLTIKEKKTAGILLSTGEAIKSRNLAKLLQGSESVLLMGATAGSDIMDAIGEDLCGQLTRGVVLDATASEMVDSALDWMMAYFNHILCRESGKLTKRRLSCGYGDFFLNNQQWIYRALGLDQLGVRLTEAFLLVPEKSVTAVAGIEKVEAAVLREDREGGD